MALATVALLGGGALTACSTSDAGPGSDSPEIVASTTVYADIAGRVAGDNATVQSVIADPTADPHSYEASPADSAAMTTADLVVYNGGGYDSFVDLALDNAGEVPVVRAVDEYALATGEEASNEHVWFSLPTAAAVAERVADELAEIDPDNADEYRDNARGFTESLTPLEERLDRIQHRGHLEYVQTERVGQHLFDTAHLVDLTPRGFLNSVEDDTDPSAADLAAMLSLLDDRRATFLAYNAQTETSVTARVRKAAEEADLVVVDLAETLPEGADYLGWITGIVDEVAAATADGPR
ncbi:metal ABC transporter solute-binding protein, Zn/Mn family [Dietzia alimentaria]|uniref:metal ABC transporter solute-binding protein, Zn/Mn family n=1 Tax=Dietzia alimentaria TaxID=665550 RepID=UPI00029AC7D7|nr:zinc ABC transporter substrate-binding protein [Dietzia alimentaria]